jgi:outer membrane protein OmpA-like peptidoglycan-associated protein
LRWASGGEFAGSEDGQAVLAGLGGRFEVLPAERLVVLAEGVAEVPVTDAVPGYAVRGAARVGVGPVGILGGGEAGIGARVGVPAWRVFAGLDFAPGGGRDADRDGIVDSADACPDRAEDLDGFDDLDGCPETDNDGDGLADAVDRCPDEAEDRDGHQDDDGCSEPDNDGDGIADAADRCPHQAEDVDGHQDGDGCPELDDDGDGIADGVDRCPRLAEKVNGFRDDDGCPDERPAYVFSPDTPVILYSIEFERASDALLADSARVLDDVMLSLQAQPEVRVRVEGHTDDMGDDDVNLRLSQRRALSVVNYLVGMGIDRARLTYEGYGETRPLLPNDSAENRARNRRVEFLALPERQVVE